MIKKNPMALLTVNKISKSFGTRLLFDDVSFEVSSKDHIGFIGVNGSGKTTLFKILTGEEQPDSGYIHKNRLLQIGVLGQIPQLNPGQSVFDTVLMAFAPLLMAEEELNKVNLLLQQGNGDELELIKRQHAAQETIMENGGLTMRSRTRAALAGLGFTREEQQKEAGLLSGGELNKIMLARLLLCNAPLLLLDEPTNHLDMKAVEWLEGYLQAYTGAFIVISHDRYFLDKVTQKTMELKNGGLYISNGNYSRHVELRFGEQEALRRRYYNTQKEIRRIEGIVAQQRKWNRERNIKTAESKLKQIERLKEGLIFPEKKEKEINFTFNVKQGGGEDVLLSHGISKSYGEKLLFKDISLQIKKGEKVFLLGKNGSGKTTLLNIFSNKIKPDTGEFKLGTGIILNYYEQNMRALQPKNTVLDEVWQVCAKLQRKQVCNALAAFLFRGDDVLKTIDMLSGGEKARVQLLKLMLMGGNLLLLDEPTNHLDIASQEALEKALMEYDGAVLAVTHDRYLVNTLADRVLYLQDGGLKETIGGYDDFLASLDEEEIKAPSKKEKPLNDYQIKKERQIEAIKLREKIGRLEKEIEKQEISMDEINGLLQEPHIINDYKKAAQLSKKAEEHRFCLDDLYKKWEETSFKMQEIQKGEQEA